MPRPTMAIGSLDTRPVRLNSAAPGALRMREYAVNTGGRLGLPVRTSGAGGRSRAVIARAGIATGGLSA